MTEAQTPDLALRDGAVVFPAFEPAYRTARQRCTAACAEYNRQADFVSPERRAFLWQDIVAKSTSQLASPDERNKVVSPTTESSAAKKVAKHDFHGPDGASVFRDGNLGTDCERSEGFDGPVEPRSKRPSQELVTKQGSEVLNDIDSTNAGEEDVSGKSQQDHDPAITNPFIVNVPYVKPPLFVDYGSNLHIGKDTFINRGLKIIDSPVCPIKIGERCQFGPNVTLASVEHPLNARERIAARGAPSFASPIVVEDDCWIAANVVILCGVRIGRGSVIGAGSVVTKDVMAGHLAYGNPARMERLVSPDYAAASRISDTGGELLPLVGEVKSNAQRERKPNSALICQHDCFQNFQTLHKSCFSIQVFRDVALILFGVAGFLYWLGLLWQL